MMGLTEMIVERLREECGTREIYAGFDAVPLPKKSDRLFAVAEMTEMKLEPPVRTVNGNVRPFTAQAKISVVIPMDAPVSRAEAFLYETVMPVMEVLGMAACEVKQAVCDARLQKVVLAAVFRLHGLYFPFGEAE